MAKKERRTSFSSPPPRLRGKAKENYLYCFILAYETCSYSSCTYVLYTDSEQSSE